MCILSLPSCFLLSLKPQTRWQIWVTRETKPNMNPKAKDLLKKKSVYISVSVVGDGEIKKLNKKYRKKDYPTDVLSFNIDQNQEDGSYYLGDVIVNKDQAKRQCKE